MAAKNLPFPIRPNITEGLANDIKVKQSATSLSQDETRKLLGTARRVYERGRELIKFVDTKRELAGVSGIETISIELSSLLDTTLRPVFDELEDASGSNRGAALSLNGLDALRRADMLIAESASNLSRFMDDRQMGGFKSLGQVQQVQPEGNYFPAPMGQAVPAPLPTTAPSSDLASIAIISIVVTGFLAAIFAVLFSSKK